MYDIEIELNRILKKIPQFGITSDFAENLVDNITEIIQCIDSNAEIVLRGGGKYASHLMDIISNADKKKNIVGIFDKNASGEICGIRVRPLQEQNKIKFDTVILASHYCTEEMRYDYDSNDIKVIDIQKELEKRGIILYAPFYLYKKNSYFPVINYIKEYHRTESCDSLIKAIDSLLLIRDFITAEILIREFISRGWDADGIYLRVINEIHSLFKTIKKMLEEKEEDIIWYWTDAVSYKTLNWMPWVYEHKYNGLFLENAYTTTPYTTQATRALFQGLLPIDDYNNYGEEISYETSKVIRYLSDKEIDFVHIGFDDTRLLSREYSTSIDGCNSLLTGPEVPSTIVLWMFIREAVMRNKPACYNIHIFFETHDAIAIADLEEFNAFPSIEKNENYIRKQFEYIDNEIKFFDSFLNSMLSRIFMSDHGSHHLCPRTFNFHESKIHPYFIVTGKDITRKIERKLFSYTDFLYIIKFIVEKKSDFLEKAFKDFVYIQDYDWWNPVGIDNFVREGIKEHGMAYRGVVTNKDRFFILGNKNEYYYDSQNEAKDIDKYVERITELKAKAGEYFLDIDNIEKFSASRRLYK